MAFARTATSTLAAAAAVVLLLSDGTVLAQQPTPAQTSAIRASCRSDFMANCSGVQPGGREALECLQRNLAKLSSACQTAVGAITPAAPPAAAPAAAPAQPTAPAAAPAPAQTSVPPSAPPQTAKPATAPKPAPAAKLNPPPASPPVAAPAPPPPAAAAAPTVAPLTPRPMILPQRRVVIVGICRTDVAKLCSGVPPGGERIIDCLAANAASLSPQCYDAIARVSR